MHGLAERLVPGLDQHHEFGLQASRSAAVLPKSGLSASIGCTMVHVSGNSMIFGAFQFEQSEIAPRTAVGAIDRHEHQGRCRLDQSIGPAVHHAELKALAILIGSDQSFLAESDARRGTGHAPEQQPGRYRETQQADQAPRRPRLMFAAGLAGAMAPNPTVVSVWELKKKHCRNRPVGVVEIQLMRQRTRAQQKVERGKQRNSPARRRAEPIRRTASTKC